jgi:hypothetical protein
MAGTLTISTLSDGTNSTSSTNCIQGSSKAWVNFNGTGTVAIRASYNVSSITDNGTGDYTVNFTNAFADANYATIMTSVNRESGSSINQSFGYYCTDNVNATGYTSSAVRISTAKTSNATGFADTNTVSVACFR